MGEEGRAASSSTGHHGGRGWGSGQCTEDPRPPGWDTACGPAEWSWVPRSKWTDTPLDLRPRAFQLSVGSHQLWAMGRNILDGQTPCVAWLGPCQAPISLVSFCTSPGLSPLCLSLRPAPSHPVRSAPGLCGRLAPDTPTLPHSAKTKSPAPPAPPHLGRSHCTRGGAPHRLSAPSASSLLQCGAGPFVIPRASLVWALPSPQNSSLWTEVWVLQWARPKPSSPGCVCGQNASREDGAPKEEVAFPEERQRDVSPKRNRVMHSLLSGLGLHAMFSSSGSARVSVPRFSSR